MRSKVNLDTGDAAMLLVVGIWAGNNIIVKAYVDRIGTVPYVFGRFVIVCVLLFAWLAFRGTDLRIARRDIPTFLFTGIAGFAIYNLLFTAGLERTSAFSVAVLVGLGPIFALIFTALLRIERVRPVQWAGVVCAMLGVTVFVSEKATGGSSAVGDLFAITAAAIFAAYTLATRPIVQRYGSPVVTAWSALIGLMVSLPITLPAALDEDWRRLGAPTWMALFYSGAISMLVAYTIWGWAIGRKGVGRTVPYLYLVPLITGVLAVTVLGEEMTIVKIIGGVLILVGVNLARRTAILIETEPDAPMSPSPAVNIAIPAD